MSQSFIEIRGAREHNLKNISLSIPRNQLVVITGLSGSGKSSLAFDTIYAEGQRRYLESLSSYARQFLEKLKKPDVDYMSGLSPAIAIEQRAITHNPRSTVATVTEIYDFLRLLYAKAGEVFCYECHEPLHYLSRERVSEEIANQFQGEEIQIFAPLVRGRKGEFQKLFQTVLKRGFSRIRIDGKIQRLTPTLKLSRHRRHDIEVFVDQIRVSLSDENKRLARSLNSSLDISDGSVLIQPVGARVPIYYSLKLTCPNDLVSYPDLTPNLFSFNSPYGACPECKGIGKISQIVGGGLLKDKTKPLFRGALNEEIFFSFNKYILEELLHDLSQKFNFAWDTPYENWPDEAKEAFLWGDDEITGFIEELDKAFHNTQSEVIRKKIRQFLKESLCKVCGGKRLRKESLWVKIDKKDITELTAMPISTAVIFFDRLEIAAAKAEITAPVLKEIKQRLRFLEKVGLGYLSLDRSVSTLSGGELQRIRLGAQIGVGLTGVLYVLDEPSIGLHPKDNGKLLDSLEHLRDMKNTVLVVEHDEETMRRADYLIDLGPGAGVKGGEVVAWGNAAKLQTKGESLTQSFLLKHRAIELPLKRKEYKKSPCLELIKCEEHNLKKINVKFPLGLFICVTGVSGSGKSTLIHDILYKAVHNHIWKSDYDVGKFKQIKGLEQIDKIIEIDQSPIGRTPRSIPATYTEMFGFVRKVFSDMPEAKFRRYTASRFSFNLKGGRCENCQGTGFERLQMSFMHDVFVVCEECRGERYNPATLEIKYKGKNIAEVLRMTIEEATIFFDAFSFLKERLSLLRAIGLGYLSLGQSSTSLSGGEAQRIKLASELSKKSTGKTLYLLDEPTTGLHFGDIENLLKALFQLREAGNTIVVIEHNLDVIKTADYIIDLGPEGGPEGGELVGIGTPEELALNPKSYTGKYLKQHMMTKKD